MFRGQTADRHGMMSVLGGNNGSGYWMVFGKDYDQPVR
jgi:hypothetical protein